MNRKLKNRLILLLSFVLMICTGQLKVSAGENMDKDIPTQNGVSLTLGSTYDPDNNIDFYMVSGFRLYDYDKIWKHKAPENLRFKIEGNVGVAHAHKMRLVASVNMFALYYLDFLETQSFKPYVEGGIGIIYTDFQVIGQGLRVNFNPQMGLGAEIITASDKTVFLAFRLHHLSNANLDDENRGVNSVMCMLGFYF